MTEHALWRALLTVTTQLPAALDSELQREHGITHFEYRMLSALAAAPDHTLRLKVLAQQTDASLSRLSHVVRKSHDRAWLTRIGGQSRVHAVLTEAGLAVVEQAAPTAQTLAHELVLDALTPTEADQLLALLQTVTVQLSSAVRDRITSSTA
jgi:DNA-binding MarR family transcriptional regulator